MSDNSSDYWAPLSALVSSVRCWVRVAVDDGESRWVGPWGLLLTIPTRTYLESSGGPVLARQVTWVQIALEYPVGGRAGIPLQFRDMSDQLLPSVRALPVPSELRDETWAMEGVFDERPIRVVHFKNPHWRVEV